MAANIPTPEPITVSVQGAMDMIGIRPTLMYELMNKGEFETVRIGTRRLVRVDSIKSFIARNAA